MVLDSLLFLQKFPSREALVYCFCLAAGAWAKLFSSAIVSRRCFRTNIGSPCRSAPWVGISRTRTLEESRGLLRYVTWLLGRGVEEMRVEINYRQVEWFLSRFKVIANKIIKWCLVTSSASGNCVNVPRDRGCEYYQSTWLLRSVSCGQNMRKKSECPVVVIRSQK